MWYFFLSLFWLLHCGCAKLHVHSVTWRLTFRNKIQMMMEKKVICITRTKYTYILFFVWIEIHKNRRQCQQWRRQLVNMGQREWKRQRTRPHKYTTMSHQTNTSTHSMTQVNSHIIVRWMVLRLNKWVCARKQVSLLGFDISLAFAREKNATFVFG